MSKNNERHDMMEVKNQMKKVLSSELKWDLHELMNLIEEINDMLIKVSDIRYKFSKKDYDDLAEWIECKMKESFAVYHDFCQANDDIDEIYEEADKELKA